MENHENQNFSIKVPLALCLFQSFLFKVENYLMISNLLDHFKSLWTYQIFLEISDRQSRWKQVYLKISNLLLEDFKSTWRFQIYFLKSSNLLEDIKPTWRSQTFLKISNLLEEIKWTSLFLYPMMIFRSLFQVIHSFWRLFLKFFFSTNVPRSWNGFHIVLVSNVPIYF